MKALRQLIPSKSSNKIMKPLTARESFKGRHTHALHASNATGTAEKRTPAAKAAIFTGTYASVAGLALTLAPITVFGLLFDASVVPRGWIRVGGILFTLIGMQYLGAGLRDGRLSLAAIDEQASSLNREVASTEDSTHDLHSSHNQQATFYSRSFYEASVWSRLFLAVGFCILVALKESPPGLLVLAALNTLGALSMLGAVRATDGALRTVQ